MCDAPDILYGRRFDNEQASTRERHMTEMDGVPIGGFAILRGVLTHRSDHNAVRKREGTDVSGRKQLTHVSVSLFQ